MAIDIEGYISFVNSTIAEYKKAGDLVRFEEITPDRINRALAMYYPTALALSAEYQRLKMEEADLNLEFKTWWDGVFQEAKRNVINSYGDSKTKPSVTEFEVSARTLYASEYKEWQQKLIVAEAKSQFLLRMRETLNKLDSILVTLSANLRSEMRSLSLEDRAYREEKKPDGPTGSRRRALEG